MGMGWSGCRLWADMEVELAAADSAPLQLHHIPLPPPELLDRTQRRRVFGLVSDAQHLATIRRLAHRWCATTVQIHTLLRTIPPPPPPLPFCVGICKMLAWLCVPRQLTGAPVWRRAGTPTGSPRSSDTDLGRVLRRCWLR